MTRERDRQIGATTIYAEASSKSSALWDAIAHVLLNRVADGRWADNLAGVCVKRMQFSEWDADPMDNRNLERACAIADDDPIWLGCLAALDKAMHHETVDPTGGATHFYDMSIPEPDWTNGAMLTVEIEGTRFYKGVK